MHTATDTLDRITARTEIETTTGCLVWTGDVDRDGYGRTSVHGRMRKVHRVAYGILQAALLPGVVLRQECGNRRCWRPSHMQPTTSRAATLAGGGVTAQHARAERCPQGHEYTPENTAVRCGRRHCRQCHRDRCRRSRAAKRASQHHGVRVGA